LIFFFLSIVGLIADKSPIASGMRYAGDKKSNNHEDFSGQQWIRSSSLIVFFGLLSRASSGEGTEFAPLILHS
jgi:hypothetical protein